MREAGRAAQALLVRITRLRLSKGVTAFLSPLSSLNFPGSRISNATIRNMPPFAFGIHNEQHDCDMVII